MSSYLLNLNSSDISPASGLDPWFNIAPEKRISAAAFSENLGQLMLQSWCSWSSFPTQEKLYLKLLTGPFITVVKFSRPPGASPALSTDPALEEADSTQSRKRRRVEEEDGEEVATPLHELIPRKYAPELVVWDHHIFADPFDSTCGLSAALRYALHCVTEDIIKGFDRGLQMEHSSIFNFAGFADHRFDETEDSRVRWFFIIVVPWRMIHLLQATFKDAVAAWYDEREQSGQHYDPAAAADREDGAKYQGELLTRRSPLREYYRERQVYTPTGELIPSPSISENSPYIPTPEKSKRSRGPSNPPSSPSPAPPVELTVGSLPIHSTRYQLRLNSRPQ